MIYGYTILHVRGKCKVDRISIFVDFLVCLVVGMNAMVAIGLLSRLGTTFVVPKWKNFFILSSYTTMTFTIALMTEQLLGVICLSYLPLLAIYEFLDYRHIIKAIVINPYVYILYYWIYGIEVSIQDIVYIVITTYVALALLLYMFGKTSNSQRRLLVSGIFIGTFEILNQIKWYNFTSEEAVVAVLTNVVSYVVAIILIDLLCLALIKEATKDYTEKYIDKLTNLYNYNSFNADYNGESAEENYVMGVVDIDGFKKINDTYGHHQGNKALETLSDLISEAVSEHYKLLNYKVYRYGGEEIIIVVKRTNDKSVFENMNEIANILLMVNEQLGDKTEEKINERVSFSAGITAYEMCQYNNEDTFTRADKLLYQAKENRSTVVVVDDGIE